MSTPTVQPDVKHPSATISVTYDSFVSQGIFPLAVWTGARAFFVTNLEDGSANQSATMLARSLFAYGIPREGTRHPSPKINAVVVGYQTADAPGQDDAVFILVLYKTIVFTAQQQGSAVLDSDDSVTVDATTQLHPDTFEPLQFSWSDPADPKGASQTDTATMSYPMELRRVVAYGVYSSAQMDALVRPALRSVNDSEWLGLDRAMWKVSGISSALTLSSNALYLAKLTIETKVDVDWRSVAIFRDTHTGKYVQVDKAITKTAKSTPYDYSIFYKPAGKGVIVSGMYPLRNFKAILGFG